MSYDVNEIYELSSQVASRLNDDSLFRILSTASRTGDLHKLLQMLQMSDLIQEDGAIDLRAKRVLVLGESAVSKGELVKVIRGFGLSEELFDFELDYDFAKKYGIKKLAYSDKYCAVMVGQLPHKGKGVSDSSSMITQMENNPDRYPPVIRITDSHHLKVSKTSFKNALERLPGVAA